MAEIVDLSGKPVDIEPGERPPAPGVVARLQELVERAKRGHIRAFAIALVHDDQRTGTMYEISETEPYGHQLMAAICYLQYRYAAHKNERAVPQSPNEGA